MSTVTCLNQIALSFVDSRSDKLYIIQVVQLSTGNFETNCYWGRRGSSLNLTNKYKGPSLAAANAEANKVSTAKQRSGYTHHIGAIPGMPASAPEFSGSPTTTSVSPVASPAVTGPLPMLANAVEGDEALSLLLKNDLWVAQRKYDGERVTVSVRRSAIAAFNRKGQSRPLSKVVEDSLKELVAQKDFSDERETVFDGELMGDVYVIFTVLTLRNIDMRKRPFFERYAALEMLLADKPHLLAPTYWTEEEKKSALSEAETNNWEGLVFWNMDAEYSTGRSSSLMKHKLWATCTCRVMATNTRRSVQLALLDDSGEEVFCGNVTVPVNQDMPDPDDLVEVRYLYAHEGGSLYQPTLLRVRDDIDDADLRSSIKLAPPERT